MAGSLRSQAVMDGTELAVYELGTTRGRIRALSGPERVLSELDAPDEAHYQQWQEKCRCACEYDCEAVDWDANTFCHYLPTCGEHNEGHYIPDLPDW